LAQPMGALGVAALTGPESPAAAEISAAALTSTADRPRTPVRTFIVSLISSRAVLLCSTHKAAAH
jgi:hypothetical protein